MCSAILHVSTKDIVRCDTPLTIGWSGEWYLGRVARHEVLHLDRVPDGINIGIRRLQKLVHLDPTARSDRQTCIDSELVFGSHSNSHDDKLRRQSLAGTEANNQSFWRFFEGFCRLA